MYMRMLFWICVCFIKLYTRSIRQRYILILEQQGGEWERRESNGWVEIFILLVIFYFSLYKKFSEKRKGKK